MRELCTGLGVLFACTAPFVCLCVYVEVFSCCQIGCLFNRCRQLCNWNAAWGGAVHPQSERWRNNRGGGWVYVWGCVCVSVVTGGVVGVERTGSGGRSPGDQGPWSVTEATASLSGSIHSIPACSPTQSGQNQLSACLNRFQWQP